ncbi:MAG: fumarylacetoacetate hydrolase family protein [Acidimicrobiales bacterium]|nr:fumarylacetoacetate hydrolase family protein [Acidimicrobiales bacterium]
MAFRLAVLNDGRAVLLDAGLVDPPDGGGRSTDGATARWWDLGRLTDGRLADPMAAVSASDALDALTDDRGIPAGDPDGMVGLDDLGPPVPRPQKVFGIGMNYLAHIDEMGRAPSTAPVIFTKFPSCLVGPSADVRIVGDRTDYEVELVAVIGRTCRDLDESEVWDALAGVTVGQDISERALQNASAPAQFSLGKSYDTFGPIGPAVVSSDLLDEQYDLQLTCAVDGEIRQDSRTSHMIVGVKQLVAYLSAVCTLEAGDLVFTGTPAGVGDAQGRCLGVGQRIDSHIVGVGHMVNHCV